MNEQQASEMLHWLQVIARDLALVLDLMPRPKCTECNGKGFLDRDVSVQTEGGSIDMAAERECIHCNGSGVG